MTLRSMKISVFLCRNTVLTRQCISHPSEDISKDQERFLQSANYKPYQIILSSKQKRKCSHNPDNAVILIFTLSSMSSPKKPNSTILFWSVNSVESYSERPPRHHEPHPSDCGRLNPAAVRLVANSWKSAIFHCLWNAITKNPIQRSFFFRAYLLNWIMETLADARNTIRGRTGGHFDHLPWMNAKP